ncbi:FHA domain-containing protein [Rhodococcus oryzae]|uniref:FHA domain-containing protein n=1 Tax=Rhodococcus oryzae TaxID=2571143 RepID=A0ABY2RLU7_9NOCA|nr:FHA domain-containing protein [Rhodococcus oryzae]TJZ79276.1 FHA domain-containing protein [Rhodococcus oryzae]
MSRLDGPRLSYTDDDGIHRELALVEESPRVTVGRARDADIGFASDHDVALLHAAIEWTGTHWTIVDDGLSRTGTFVNGERLSGRRRLQAGDSIGIGSSVLTFLDTAPSGDSAGIADAMPTRTALTPAQQAIVIELCRPFKGRAAACKPASNQQIAEQLFVSVETVKTHLRTLFAKFGVEDLPQNRKRAKLAERALQSGVVTDRDL